MTLNVEKISNLERKLTISVPHEEIEIEVQKQLQELTHKVKIDGFRPGKVPFKIIKTRFYDSVLGDVLEKKIKASYVAALQKENLHPAGSPRIEPSPYQPGQPFKYTATLEIYPEVTLGDLSQLEVTKVATEITEQDVNEMLETVRKQFATWEETDNGAEEGDRIIIDFLGTVEGQPFKNNSGKEHEILLGTKHYHPDFVKNLYGAKKGADINYSVTYPGDYLESELANKTADFSVQVKRVLHPKLAELNEEFAKKMGVKSGNIDDLKSEIKKNMQREVESKIQKNFRDAILNQLVEKNPVEIPKTMVESEVQRLSQEEENMLQRYAQHYKIKNKDALPRADSAKLANIAQRNAAMTLLLGEVVNKLNIQLDKDRLKKKIEDLASTYQDPEQAINWYYSNDNELKQVSFLVLEDQVLESLEKQVKVIIKTVPYKEALV